MAITITPRAVAKRAADVLGYARILARERHPITAALIAGRFGWAVASAQAVIDQLAAEGLMERGRRRHVAPRRAAPGRAGTRAAAGLPVPPCGGPVMHTDRRGTARLGRATAPMAQRRGVSLSPRTPMVDS